MKKTDYNVIMKEEIQKRLNGNAWDFNMALKVMEKKSGKKRSASVLWVFASSGAALLVIVFLFGIKNASISDKYDQFVKLQIRGTYNDVFNIGLKTAASSGAERSFILSQVSETHREVFQKDAEAGLSKNSGAEIISSNDVDSLIDDVLIMR